MYSIYGKTFNSFGYDSSDYFFNKKIRVGKVGNDTENEDNDNTNVCLPYELVTD